MTRLKPLIFLLLFFGIDKYAIAQRKPLYRDQNSNMDVRAKDLLNRLTLEEKALLLGYNNQGVPRLGIPAYNWWNEGLHGVARAGVATVFPQAIGMAATFDPLLVKQVGETISTEARAKHNLAVAKNNYGAYMGLTFWSPNINIFRDPRWGRGQETYGEDPFLTASIGLAYVHGMQGGGPFYKTAAAAKHFVAHSGPENTRDYFNAKVLAVDLNNTYLYAFKKLVKGGVAGLMTAYNEVNGVPNSVNSGLLRNTLRKDWGFKGYIVTDCGALDDVFSTHKYLKTRAETAAAAIKAGINLDCSTVLQKDVKEAVRLNLITSADVDGALLPLLLTQIKLGFFDDPKLFPYRKYLADSIHNAGHIAVARRVAQQSMVLLKNDNNILPLNKDKLKSIMVIGPNAANMDVLAGNYHGLSPGMINFAEGITAAVDKGTRVEYDQGAGESDTTHFGGVWAASNSDVTVAVIGLSPVVEGEAGDAFLSPVGGDKKDLQLPKSHVAFMKALRAGVKKSIIAVVTAGSDVDIAAIASYADAVILAWYPGEQGGNALADIIFGKVSPSGKLPVTFYKSINDLPAFDNYNMQGRTYRYFTGEVQFPFGSGLSYSAFDITSDTRLKAFYTENDTIKLNCTVRNTGKMHAAEILQAYIQYPEVSGLPNKELKFFARVELNSSASKVIDIRIPVEELKKWDENINRSKLYTGNYQLVIGNSSANNAQVRNFSVKNETP